jgi:hypothetical protein
MEEQLFNTEIEKILSINRINLEIWNRINPQQTQQYQIKVIKRITLKNNVISFFQETIKLDNINFTPCFDKVPNFFNDTLPVSSYFDMNNIILKYSMLNPKKALQVVAPWKTALEKIQVYLGVVEAHERERREISENILKLFNFTSSDTKYLSCNGNKLTNFEFEIGCDDSCFDLIALFAQVIVDNFTVKEGKKFFNYVSDFDENGLIYNIGTQFGLKTWTNPIKDGKVKILTSTRHSCSINEELLAISKPPPGFFCTENVQESWVIIKIIDYRIIPSAYTLRSDQHTSYKLRTWELQGSLDGENWKLIKRHDNDLKIDSPSMSTSSWEIKDCTEAYSCFRIIQKGNNSTGNHHLMLSGFEVYGTLI